MWALVPIRSLRQGKRRLAGVLSGDQRYRLTLAMYLDVLEVLSSTPGIAGVTVVSDDEEATELAVARGADCLREQDLHATGLNGAVKAAVARLAERGINEVLVVHGDLPLLQREELVAVLQSHAALEQPALTVVTDRQGGGSNCVLASPAAGFDYRYGVNSRQSHVAIAEGQGRTVQVLSLPGASMDIDTPADYSQLRELISAYPRGHTAKLLSTTESARVSPTPPGSA